MRFFNRTLAIVLAGVLWLSSSKAFADSPPTFQEAGFHAVHDLIGNFYAGGGKWRNCENAQCNASNRDWGVDSAVNAVYMRWEQTHNPEFGRLMSEMLGAAPQYGGPCTKGTCSDWSDTPAWDAVAAMREYDVLQDPQALANAKAALRYVEHSNAFYRGACAAIPFQHPPQEQSRVKTLETTANAVRADLLVYGATHDDAYLRSAQAGYEIARQYYLDPALPLYTVHVRDDGTTCTQVAHRFFASVNGDMISNGIGLWRATGDRRYADQAIATAHAVVDDLSDGRGIFVNMQGDNDVAQPLVEAMLDLAQREHLDFARNWILRNADAALGARTRSGSFPRFFDGPSQLTTSIWEANGGYALEIAAAAIAPNETPAFAPAWDGRQEPSVSISSLPATIDVDGSGVALVGTIGRQCERGHIRVIIDGVETTDQTGLWQNPSMPHGSAVLFAWRWAVPGRHTVVLQPGDASAAMPNVLSLSSYVTR